MQVDDEALLPRLRKPLAIAALVLFVLVGPTWLWFVFGRQLALRVVVESERYVAAAGSQVALHARVTPSSGDIDLRWHGPGVEGSATRARWRLPHEPGLYTATLAVRRSGSTARDSVTVEVLPEDPDNYPLALPPQPIRLPRHLARGSCSRGTDAASSRLRIHGKACPGANLVVEALEVGSLRSWLRCKGSSERFRPGPLVNLRLPRRADTAEHAAVIELILTEGQRRCVRRLEHRVAPQPCVGGPRKTGVFADFGWQMIGPSLFRLAAKPPRQPLASAVRYRWSFGDGRHTTTTNPTVVHRYGDGQAQHIVQLQIEASDARDDAVKVVTDRTVLER